MFQVTSNYSKTSTLSGGVSIAMTATSTNGSIPDTMQVAAAGYLKAGNDPMETGQYVNVSGTFNFTSGLFAKYTANSTPVAFMETLETEVKAAYEELKLQIRAAYPEEIPVQ